jgi:hypothetical protein
MIFNYFENNIFNLRNKRMKTGMYEVRFQVLTATSTDMAVSWVDVPCNLVEVS